MGADTSVGIGGDGPGVRAIEAAFEDVGVACSRINDENIGSVDLPIVVAPTGSRSFVRANESRERWIAVELGGIGGYVLADIDAAITVFDSAVGCFECLRKRVASNVDVAESGEPQISRIDARLAGAHAGRTALALLSGEIEPGRVLELPYAERRLLGVPGCSCDTDPDRTVGRDDADATIEEAVGRAEEAIDDRIGIVSSIGEAESFPAPYYLATLADTSVYSDVTASPQAAGVAPDWDVAFIKAAGEALERYAAGVYREASFETAAAEDHENAIPPRSFVLPDSYEDPDPSEPIDWVPGENLRTGEPVRLPAEFVHFPPPEKRHKPSITTGLGLRTSTVGALLSGLYETIERDATMLAWYSTFEPLGLTVEDPAFGTLANRARAEDLTVTPLLVTQDIDVPVVSVTVHREGEWPRFAAGSGADLDPRAAARSALAEALQNWMELRGMGREGADEEHTAIGRFADFPREARELVTVDSTVRATDVVAGEAPSGAEELDAVIERVNGSGLDVYAARLTPRDVESLGFEAVRVLVPAAQPLFTGDRYFGERARRVPRDLGFRPRLDRGPHPYP